MSVRPKVVVTDLIHEPLDEERAVLEDVAQVVALNATCENDLVGRIEDADAIMLYHFFNLTARTIDRLEKCKLIVRCGVGYDNVDHAAARHRGIPVANVPDYGSEDVADTAIGMMLALTRGIHHMNSRLQLAQGDWSYTQAQPLFRLRGRVFGVVGIGRIGTAAALRAKSLGMNVMYFDPHVHKGMDKALGIREAETLEELLQASHVVSLHCPHTPETHHLIHRENIRWMRAGSFLINTARGALVDILAVLDAVTTGHLSGAGIDVLEMEPPPPDHPLVRAWRDPAHPAHDRIILNPHAAFYTEEGAREMRAKGSRNCRRVLLGQTPHNVIN